jgi:DNA-binding LytR/AlgR family response regulator
MTVYKHIWEIIYVEVYAHQLIFHCSDGEYSMRGRLENAENQLNGYGFVKTHRSYLINMRFLKRIELRNVILDAGKIINIPLSKYRVQDVKNEFLKYMI